MSSIYNRMVEQADQLAKDRVERNAEIARLKAENQQLATERDGAEKAGRAEAERFMAQLDEVRAENQRLREAPKAALTRLENVDGNLLLTIHDAQVILREALAGDAE